MDEIAPVLARSLSDARIPCVTMARKKWQIGAGIERLRGHMKRAVSFGVSQKAIAGAIDRSESWVSKFVAGTEGRPDADDVEEFYGLLGRIVADLDLILEERHKELRPRPRAPSSGTRSA